MNEHDTVEMNKFLSHLAAARMVVQLNQQERTAILEAAQKTPEYIAAGESLEEGKKLVAQFEEYIRELAKVNFINTQDKHPHPSVEVKIFRTFKVISPDVVREWVLKNLPAALSPDMKKVEKYALEIGPVDGTEKGEEARVQIATKL